MRRKLISAASALALLLAMCTVQAGAQFVVEIQAQTTVDAVLEQFPSPTAEDLLAIYAQDGDSGLPDPGEGCWLTDPTMGSQVNVVRSSAPAQVAVLSIPHWDTDLGEKVPRDTFVFQVPIGTVIDNDAGLGGLDPVYLGRMDLNGEEVYDNTYFDLDGEYMAVKLSMPVTIETTDIYSFGFVDSVYGYVYVQGVDETDGGETGSQPEEIVFSDVPAGAYYEQPVRWAVAGGITAGTDEAKAASWALAEGITAGTGEGTFGPEEICTRGQIMTFLYRNLAV